MQELELRCAALSGRLDGAGGRLSAQGGFSGRAVLFQSSGKDDV